MTTPRGRLPGLSAIIFIRSVLGAAWLCMVLAAASVEWRWWPFIIGTFIAWEGARQIEAETRSRRDPKEVWSR